MPKEIVHGDAPFGPDDDPLEVATEVRWSRETEHVQIATVLRNRSTGENQDLAGRDVCGGMFCTLDRRGINDMIRYLRRARDQAFGRDE